MKLYLKGEVKIYPTEDPGKVKTAIENLFSSLNFKLKTTGETQTLIFWSEKLESLQKLKNILRQDQVRDAVRSFLLGRVFENKLKFYLNKQVAYAGHVSICEPQGESPLGPIEVEIECENPRKLIDWLSPSSQKA